MSASRRVPRSLLTTAVSSAISSNEYVTVHASVRGTGCSSGEFDLFSWRSALDGKEIIDNWIPNQPWSDGAVGLLGHSYGGITGFMVAATQPQHLKAATLSGLIDDLYRGIVSRAASATTASRSCGRAASALRTTSAAACCRVSCARSGPRTARTVSWSAD
jgi:putative CocE/NonD family hydrolase